MGLEIDEDVDPVAQELMRDAAPDRVEIHYALDGIIDLVFLTAEDVQQETKIVIEAAQEPKGKPAGESVPEVEFREARLGVTESWRSADRQAASGHVRTAGGFSLEVAGPIGAA